MTLCFLYAGCYTLPVVSAEGFNVKAPTAAIVSVVQMHYDKVRAAGDEGDCGAHVHTGGFQCTRCVFVIH